MSSFAYFPVFPTGAHLSTESCGYCGKSPAISGTYLRPIGDGSETKAVCGDCLAGGRASVKVPKWVERELAEAVNASRPDWSEERRSVYVAERVAELSHTPPVPWIQNNEWPVCHDDFAQFVGELTREQLEKQHGSTRAAIGALRAAIAELRPEWEQSEANVEWEWAELGNFLAIFVFHCQDRQREIYVLQTA